MRITCQSVSYLQANRIVITRFSQKNATLPVLCKASEIKHYPWGRRQDEVGLLPLGGWLNLDQLNQKTWDKYFPKRVKIPIQKFMEKDIEGNEAWFDVTAGQYLQGAYLREQGEQRIYVVTLTSKTLENPYLQWPLLVAASDGP